MPINNPQNDTDFPAGFLVKDKRGQLKKVQDGKVTELSKPASVPPPAKPVPPRQPNIQPRITPSPKPVVPSAPLQPRPPVSSSKEASFAMDAEDEEELKKHAEALKLMMEQISGSATTPVEAPFDTIARELATNVKIQFANDVLKKRFTKILESRWRNIRDAIETEEALTRPEKIGGLGLTNEQASQVVLLLEEKISQAPQPTKTAVTPSATVPPIPEKKGVPSASAMYPAPPPAFIPRPAPRPQVQASVQPPRPAPVMPVSPPVAAPVAPPPVVPRAAPVVPAPTTAVPQPRIEELYGRPVEELPRRIAAVPADEQRPRVADITLPTSVVGPVEELADIDLKEFRRLASDPSSAADKILEKIELLEEESWQLRVDGIRAWQKSPTYQLYVEVGRECVESGLSVEEVIRLRQKANRPFILFDEFQAINSLNNKLAI